MKTLSLFVDKWFITVAVNNDGNVMPLSLPNGEDRIWLYFHEDIANNRIVYGKTYENNYRDKEPHYFGDIFSLIETDEYHFTRYDNRPEEMRDIFKVSNIFSHLREAIDEETEVNTYISFSADISDIARLKFIKELEESNFKVIESVARISHLALEESKKRGIFVEDGMYIALVATNDNMHFSLYKATENIFVRISENSLLGYGLDVRKRALIETVVENINRTTRFLSTVDEYALEYMRQERFVDEWLSQIHNRRYGLPVTIPNITFAIAPNNPYSVTIKPTDLDQRTSGLVDDIVRKIADFVRVNNVQSHEIKGIAFIGNTFTNSEFTSAINARFIVDERHLIKYLETGLPKVVNIYSQIDCSQFREATSQFVKDATTQELLNQQAREEEKRKKIAQAEAKRQIDAKAQKQKADKEYASAIEHVERFESEHNYEQMRAWADIALTHKSEDDYAKEKLNLAQQLLAEQRAISKQFSAILQRAKKAFSEERWSDAISQSENALELKPDSDEAQRINKESKRQLDIKDKVTNYLNRADVFFAQKLYTEALDEVGKVLNLDSNNAQAKELQNKISEVNSKHDAIVADLLSELAKAERGNDFSTAISVCEKLIEEDASGIKKWTSKKESLKTKSREFQEKAHKLAELRENINKVHFDEDWTKLILLCDNFLSMEQDDNINHLLIKAKNRIKEIQVRETKDKAIGLINSLIIDGRLTEAEEELKQFEQKYTSDKSLVKDLRRKLFSFGSTQIIEQDERSQRKTIKRQLPKSSSESTKPNDNLFKPNNKSSNEDFNF